MRDAKATLLLFRRYHLVNHFSYALQGLTALRHERSIGLKVVVHLFPYLYGNGSALLLGLAGKCADHIDQHFHIACLYIDRRESTKIGMHRRDQRILWISSLTKPLAPF